MGIGKLARKNAPRREKNCLLRHRRTLGSSPSAGLFRRSRLLWQSIATVIGMPGASPGMTGNGNSPRRTGEVGVTGSRMIFSTPRSRGRARESN
jgi:hypothetical protein